MQTSSIPAFVRLLLVAIALTGIASVHAAERKALVIGNGAYVHTATLRNPTNDAADIGAVLKGLGFDVQLSLDLDKTQFDNAIPRFIASLGRSTVGLIYYAGHSVQYAGENYLLPVDAALGSIDDLKRETVRLSEIVEQMEQNTDVRLVFLDACRNNPLAITLAESLGDGAPVIGRGLSLVNEPSAAGTLIVYATQPGNVALDGVGRNSPFAASLVKRLAVPRLDAGQMTVSVRRDVVLATGGRQVPWAHSSLLGDFYFNESVEAPSAAEPLDRRAYEIVFWDSVKDAASAELITAYLDRFPDGLFKDVAALRLAGLRRKTSTDTNLPADTATPERDRPHKCDRLAAGLFDEHAVSPEIDFEELNTVAAIQACRAAIAAYPEVKRFRYQLARALTRDDQFQEAHKLFKPLAEAGYAAAMFEMGENYFRAEGVQQNTRTALIWWERAAKAGNPRGARRIAEAYQTNDHGVSRNAAAVRTWNQTWLKLLRTFAGKGNTTALVNLGAAYEKGIGVRRNYTRARELYLQALKAGNHYAAMNLGYLHYHGRGVQKDPAKAARYIRQAAEMGNARGLAELGFLYANGQGVSKDPAKAIELWWQAIDKGSETAMAYMAAALQRGEGVEQDHAQSAYWWVTSFIMGRDLFPDELPRRTTSALQEWMRAEGFYKGAIDGVFGIGTENAVFQYRDTVFAIR